MRRFLLLLPLLLWPITAQAQQPLVLTTCGPTAFFTAGSSGRLTVNTKGEFCGTSSGSASTIADGADVAQGTTTDSACATDNGTCTLLALTKRNNQRLTTLIAGIPVTNAGTFAVQATLPTTGTIAAGNGVVPTPSAEAGAGVAPSANTTTGKGLVLKSGAGNLYSLAVKIGATSGYVILADATAIATDGAVTYKWCKPVASNGTLGGDDWAWNPPLAFSTGITANFSTTGCATMTGSTTAEFSGQAK